MAAGTATTTATTAEAESAPERRGPGNGVGPRGAPSNPLLGSVERLAWRIPLSSRRLFVILGLVVASALAASGLASAWVAQRNADTLHDARENGLGVAQSAIEFRTALAAADAEAANSLIAGGLDDVESRARYEANLAKASQALANAGLVATDDDTESLATMAEGITRYSALVATSRENARQGNAVRTAYMSQARGVANDSLIPEAEHLRREGEQRIANAANSIGGPIGAFAIAVLLIGLGVLLAVNAVVAGRTRRVTHPALLVATLTAIAVLVFVTLGIARQSGELRKAATDDIERYVAANDAAFQLSTLRVAEIDAVASFGSGGPIYDQISEDGGALVDELGADSELGTAVEAYVSGVKSVEQADIDEGDHKAAADEATNENTPLFQAADDMAGESVDDAATALRDRFESADGASIPPLVPTILGIGAAVLATVGVLARGRRYR